MAKTFANIKAQTRTYLDESSQSDWLDTEVEREVNAGYHEIVTAVMTTYEDFYLSTDTISLVEGQQEYGVLDGLPSDVFKINRVEVNYQASNSNSVFYKAVAVNMEEIRTRLANNTSGVYSLTAPIYYTYGFSSNFKLGLLPVPSEDSSNGLKMWYVPYIADLSSDSDSFNIPYPDRYAPMIAKYAAAVLLRKGQQEEAAAQRLMDEFLFDLSRMQRQLEDHAGGDGERIVISDVQNVDFTINNTVL